MVQPQLQPGLQLVPGILHAEDGAQNGQHDGAGHAHQGGVEGHAHAAQGGHEALAHAVEDAQPLGGVGVADHLRQGGDGERQAQEGAEEAQGHEEGDGVVEKALTQKTAPQLGGHAVCHHGGGVHVLALALVGVGVGVDHEAEEGVIPVEIAHQGGQAAVAGVGDKQQQQRQGEQPQDHRDHHKAEGRHGT